MLRSSLAALLLFVQPNPEPPAPLPVGDPPDAPAKKGVPTVDEVVCLVQADDPYLVAKVVAMGEALAPSLEQILDDPKRDPHVVSCAFSTLIQMSGQFDRSRFIDHALARLTDNDDTVRRMAIYFLTDAGSEREMGPVALLLLDEESSVRYAAARALALRGGRNEVVAFDLLLKNASRYEQERKLILDQEDIDRMEMRRDELKARLAKEGKQSHQPSPAKK